MNMVISLILRFSGINALWDKVDGHKSKIGAAGVMLSGIGLMAMGGSEVVASYTACIDHACQVDLFRNIATHPGGTHALEGFLLFKGALLGLGIWHKLDKAEKAAAPSDTPPAA